MMFQRVLIANRGEIAVRVIGACREMGIESVAVYSDADARAWHVALADHAVRIGEAAPADSYLSIERIVDAARASGAEAVHPGYGFLSERPAFARACHEAGLTFVGPPADALARMGSKTGARLVAADAGAPIVPGDVPDDQSDGGIAAAIRRVGFPALIKPVDGGGGIGMEVVRREAEIPEAIGRSRRAALSAFGNGAVYVERLIERPRHVEVQVLADRHGHAIHLFERECSIQRRHQKVIEETPSPALTPGLRRRMGDAAVAIARAAGYENAGTVEFLLDGTGDAARFYFLEMNARLQVEHPITEAVTGVDLVRAQLAIAAGEPLAWSQEDLTQRGHAIEVRIYAEDPARDHLPQAGPLLVYREPAMPGIRVDSGVTEGGEISVHYDPLIAKLIASAGTREAARRRAVAALRSFPILGIATNVAFLIGILEHPRFISGDLDIGFLDAESDALVSSLVEPPPQDVAAIADAARRAGTEADGRHIHADEQDPWSMLKGWRA